MIILQTYLGYNGKLRPEVIQPHPGYVQIVYFDMSLGGFYNPEQGQSH